MCRVQASQKVEGAETVDAYRQWLLIHMADARWQYWKRIWRVVGANGFALLMAAMMFVGDWFWKITAVVFGAGWTYEAVTIIRSMTRRWEAVVLDTVKDARLAGTVAGYTRERNRLVSAAARRALRRLLPGLQAGDGAFMTNAELRSLTALLEPPDPDLAVTCLEALAACGDARALPAFERLAGGEVDCTESERSAAERLLPVLLANLQHLRDEQTLLRAATSLEDPVGSLLRPAGPSDGVPQHLLIPAEPDVRSDQGLPA